MAGRTAKKAPTSRGPRPAKRKKTTRRGKKNSAKPAQDPPYTRAREMPDPAKVKATDKRARIQFIEDLMDLGVWHKSLNRELAEVWKLHRDTVKKDAAEASRNQQKDITPKDRAKARQDYVERLESWAAKDAMTGNSRAATRALDLAAKIQGLIVHRHEHEFEHEAREFLVVARDVLPKEWFQKLAAALAALQGKASVE